MYNYNEEDQDLSCILNATKTLFKESSFVFVIRDSKKSQFESTELENSIVLIDLNINQPLMHFDQYYASNFIFIVENNTVLKKNLEFLEKSSLWNKAKSPKGKFLIVSSTDEIPSLFMTMWEKYVLNVVVMVRNISKLYIGDPHAHENKCGEFANSFSTKRCDAIIEIKSYYRKLTGCTVRIMNVATLTNIEFDVTLYGLFSNLSIKYLNVSMADFNYPSLDDFTSSKGFYIKLLYYAHGYYKYLHTSDPIFTSEMVWLVPPPLKMSPLKALTSAFRIEVWSGILFSMFITSFLWYCFTKHYQTNSKSADGLISIVTKIWQMTFTSCIRQLPVQKPARCLLIMYLLYIINIQTAYTCNLIRIFTNPPHEKSISSLEDLANSNLTVFGVNYDVGKFKNDSKFKEDVCVKISKHLKEITYDEMKQSLIHVSTYRNCAIMIPELAYLYYRDGIPPVKEIFDSSITEQFTIAFIGNEDHYFMETFDKMFLYLKESGIYTHYSNNQKVLSLKLYNVTYDNQLVNPIVLNIKHLYIVFVLLAVVDNSISPFQLTNLENVVVFINLNKPIVNFNENYANNFIINVENHTTLKKNLEILQKSVLWNRAKSPKGNFLILSPKNEIGPLFLTMWDKYVLNVVVMITKGHLSTLYISDPHAYENKCGEFSSCFSTAKCEAVDERKTYYRKFTGCTLRVTGTPPRLSITDPDVVLTDLFLNMTVKYLNVSVVFYNITPNTSVSSRGRQINFIYHLYGTYKNYHVSDRVYTSKMIWIVPLPLKLSPFKALGSVFTHEVWCCIAFGIFVNSIVWYCITKYYNSKASLNNIIYFLFRIWEITFTGCLSKLPTQTSVRWLLITYLLYIINIQTAFTSNLIRIFTNPPYEKSISNLEELSRSNLTIYSFKIMIDNFKSYSNYKQEIVAKLRKQLKESRDLKQNLLDLVKYRNCAVMIPEKGYIEYQNEIPPVRVLYDDSITEPFAMAFVGNEHHYFMETFDKLFLLLKESGIYQHHLIIYKMLSFKQSNASSRNIEFEPVVLTMKHVYSVFVLLAVGLAWSIGVLSVELLIHKI
ncbi:hypothetical protein FQR65_LT05363 [Abscondita terminalis]|nr:hypothetical protein FQR65_LT05363 [Abscondita terminalis]